MLKMKCDEWHQADTSEIGFYVLNVLMESQINTIDNDES